MKDSKRLLIITGNPHIQALLGHRFERWGYAVFFDGHPDDDLANIISITPDAIVIDIDEAKGCSLDVCDRLKRDFATAYIPVITLIDKRHLKHQLLALKHGVDDYLIKPPDPVELRVRTEMALKRSQHSFYASSLTGLPGGVVVEETIKERMESSRPFVVGHADIDNFKSFNDKYGYLRGDRAIMQTAYMLSTVIRNRGNKDDFIGHIGGDDFVFVTTPDKFNAICQEFICMFDTIMPFLYSPKDRKRGYVLAKDRTNRMRKLSIMSVTIALVIKNTSAEIRNMIELNERVAEVKQYLKKIPGSKYMADRRMTKKDQHLSVKVFRNDEALISSYKPLGQILVDKNMLTVEELDKALKIHWRRGVPLGEVLTELGFISGKELSEALNTQALGLAEDSSRHIM